MYYDVQKEPIHGVVGTTSVSLNDLGQMYRSHSARLGDSLTRLNAVGVAIGSYQPTPVAEEAPVHEEPRNFMDLMVRTHSEACEIMDRMEARIVELETLCNS